MTTLSFGYNRYHLQLSPEETKEIFSLVETEKTKRKQTSLYEREINRIFGDMFPSEIFPSEKTFKFLTVSLRNKDGDDGVFSEAFFELENGKWKFPEGDYFDEDAPDTDDEEEGEGENEDEEEDREEGREEGEDCLDALEALEKMRIED